MPWTAESGKKYKLCLLDTNAISEIVKNPEIEGKGFIQNYHPTSVAPCFTIYNLIELRRSNDVYKKFLSFFSIYPIFLMKTQSMIVKEEIKAYDSENEISVLFNAFTPLGKNDSYNLEKFIDSLFSNSELSKLESTWRSFEQQTLNEWISGKENFSVKSDHPNSSDAEKYIEQAGLQTLIRLEMEWCKNKIEQKIVPNINKFPSVKIMLYSLYYRLYDPSWKANLGEVTDILITSAIPYVDVFITEKFQANITSKIKTKVMNLDKIRISRISDIR